MYNGVPTIIRVWDDKAGIEYVAGATYSIENRMYGFGLLSAISLLTASIAIPTVGEWGLIVMGLLFLITGTLVMRRQLAPARAS